MMRRPWKRILDAALSGLLVGLLTAGPALAQQRAPSLLPQVVPGAAGSKLTVVVVPLDAAAQSQVPRLLAQAEQAVASSGRFEWVRLADALDSQGTRAREQQAQERVSGDAVDLSLKPVPGSPRLQSLMELIADEPEGEDRDKALRELGALAGTQQVLALLVRAAPGAGAKDAIVQSPPRLAEPARLPP